MKHERDSRNWNIRFECSQIYYVNKHSKLWVYTYDTRKVEYYLSSCKGAKKNSTVFAGQNICYENVIIIIFPVKFKIFRFILFIYLSLFFFLLVNSFFFSLLFKKKVVKVRKIKKSRNKIQNSFLFFNIYVIIRILHLLNLFS